MIALIAYVLTIFAANYALQTIGCAAGQMNRVQAAVWWTGTTYTAALMALTTREAAE